MSKIPTFKSVRQDFLEGTLKLKPYQKLSAVLLVIIFSGFIGWIWEFFFDEVRNGFEVIYIKGGNLLPWINLYAFGALVVLLLPKTLRRRPALMFLASALATGTLELIAGIFVYVVWHGARYWDYSNVWWGFGHLNGFVCPASAVAFGLGSMMFVYFLGPLCFFIAKKLTKKKLLILSISLFTIVLVDEVTNLTLRALGKPSAIDFYHSLGFEYEPNEK